METKWTIKIGWPKAISPSPTSQYAYLPSTPARENNNNNNNSNNNNPRENEDPRFGRSLDVDRCLDLSGRGVVTSTRRERDSEQPRPRSEFYSRGYERLYCNSSRSNNKPTSGLQLDVQSSGEYCYVFLFATIMKNSGCKLLKSRVEYRIEPYLDNKKRVLKKKHWLERTDFHIS